MVWFFTLMLATGINKMEVKIVVGCVCAQYASNAGRGEGGA